MQWKAYLIEQPDILDAGTDHPNDGEKEYREERTAQPGPSEYRGDPGNKRKKIEEEAVSLPF